MFATVFKRCCNTGGNRAKMNIASRRKVPTGGQPKECSDDLNQKGDTSSSTNDTRKKPILGPMAGDDEVTSVLGKNPMPKAHTDNGVQERTLRGTEFSECLEIQFCASVVHIGI
jgi:hypothetical protein